MMVLLPFYVYYCKNKKIGRAFIGTLPKKHVVLGSIWFFLVLLVQILNYLMGIIYLINMVMSLIFVVLIFMCLVGGNRVFESMLKKSSILKT